MPSITSNTTFTLSKGSSVIFKLGGSGTATVAGQIYSIGNREAFIGPFDRAVSVVVSVENAPIGYRIDGDGDLADQKPEIAAISEAVEIYKSMQIAERFASRMNVLPSKTRLDAINNFVYQLLSVGIYKKFDAIYLMASHDEQAAKLNLIGSGGQDLTNVNGCLFTTDSGFSGDGSTSYLDTSLPANAAGHYSQNSGFACIWSMTELASNTANDFSGGGKMYINSRTVAGAMAARSNNSTAPASSSAVASSVGMFAISRTNSAEFSMFYNSSKLSAPAVVSEALSSTTFQIGRNSTNYSSRRIGLCAIGSGLTDEEYLSFYNAAREYMTAVGVA